jgi:SAM-dependent methyltransferase
VARSAVPRERRTCPLDATELVLEERLIPDHRYGLAYYGRFGWCRTCGLGVLVNPPTQDELRAIYEYVYTASRSATGGDPAWRPPGTSWPARVWHRINGSLPLANLELAAPVLDVGCHTGELASVLIERGLDVVGVEPNPRAAEIARSHGIEVIAEPIEGARLPARHFGTILLSQVLEHVPDPAQVLATARAALRPGGVAYVVVPNGRSLWRRIFGESWIHWHVPFHLFLFSERSLRTYAEQGGFVVRRVEYRTPGEWLLMSVIARRQARSGRYVLEHFSGRYAARLLVSPIARALDAVGQGEALVAELVAADTA